MVMGLLTMAKPLFQDTQTSVDSLVQLIRRCSRHDDIHVAFATIATQYRFDGMSYFLLAETQRGPAVMHHWTSSSSRWRILYAERQYQSIDPRIVLTQGRSVPVLWRTNPFNEQHRTTCFASDAHRCGLRSGVALSSDDVRVGRLVLSWDSMETGDDARRIADIHHQLSELMLVAGHLHEAMLAHCRSALATRPHARLTPRERECVAFAARGLTSVDIGMKLGITERTVNFHFGNITAKLGVLNRAEAIVRAIALREVQPA
jgi:DNA-binding CsgD family transcriptional regulator